jgi:hypothetical protein
VVSKTIDAPYTPGNRGLWRKAKSLNRQEFVIVGWSDPEGSRPHLGALLLGYYTDDGKLIYAAAWVRACPIRFSCASCSILFFAQDCGLNRGFTDNSDDCELSLVGSVLRPTLACLSVPRDALGARGIIGRGSDAQPSHGPAATSAKVHYASDENLERSQHLCRRIRARVLA